jgi:SAM-dependent methyltransferase
MKQVTPGEAQSSATWLSTPLQKCLLCGSTSLRLSVPLAAIPVATPNWGLSFKMDEKSDLKQSVPLDMYQCESCGHVQVGHVGNPELLYRDYTYLTVLSLGLTAHFQRYASDILDRFQPPADSLVVELGSNDGTLLRFFRDRGLRVVGVDPAREIARTASGAGIPTLPEFFSQALAERIRTEHGTAAIVIANNMIANVHDMNDFGEGLRTLLSPEGVFICETQYAADIVEKKLLDTVYHEHLSYFLVKPARSYFAAHGLELFDVGRTPSKGGSLRLFAQPLGARQVASPSVTETIEAEETMGVFSQPYFSCLSGALEDIRRQLRAFIEIERKKNRPLAGYGVSVGTTAMLPQFGLEQDIDFLVDDDLNKPEALYGPGYRIPIYPPQALGDRSPGAVVVFAWRYADSIIKQHRGYIEQGGKFIIPLPSVHVVDRAC